MNIADLLYLWYLFLSFCVHLLKIKTAWNHNRKSVCDFNSPPQKKVEKHKSQVG